MKKLETLDFKHFCMSIGNLPSSYVESLSYYECLLWLIKYLQEEVIPTVNNNSKVVEELQGLYLELKSYVETYFDNLDVQDEINNKLDEMVEDGSLESIIAKYIKFPNCYLNMKKLGRMLDETLFANSEAASDGYYGMQGGCLVDKNTYVYISNHFDSTRAYADETSKIRKISLITGNVLSEAIITVGHGNGIAYDKVNQVYYVACVHGNMEATQSLYNNKIIKLDSSFDVIETYETTINFDSLCFDENNNLYGGVTYKGDVTNGMKIFKLDPSDMSVVETYTLNDIDSVGVGQDFAIYNNLIYFLQSNPNSILTFNKNGECIMSNLLRNGNVSFIGEVENINLREDGKFIIGSRYAPTGNLYEIEQIFEIDTIRNEIDVKNYEDESIRWNFKNIYINNNVTSWNPDGSESNPFNCIDEAINFNYKNPTVLYLMGTGTYLVSRINSFSGDIYAQDGAKISCGDNYTSLMIRNSNIYFNSIGELCPLQLAYENDVKIYNSKLVATDYSQLIYIDRHSSCELEKCTFDVNTNLTNALFNNNHGRLIWNKDNQDLTTLDPSITKIFLGSVEAIVPIHIYHGELAKGNAIALNNLEIATCFKELELRFSDNLSFNILAQRLTYNLTGSNLSTAGTGANKITNLGVYIAGNTGLNFSKVNQIIFDSSGNMTIDTAPTVKLTDVYIL